MFNASITYHQGTEREFGYERTFGTEAAALEWIKQFASGMGGSARAWVNNKEISFIRTIPSPSLIDEIASQNDAARLSAPDILMPVPNPKADGPRVSTLMRELEGADA